MKNKNSIYSRSLKFYKRNGYLKISLFSKKEIKNFKNIIKKDLNKKLHNKLKSKVKIENLEDVQAINVEVKWSQLGIVDNQDFTLFTATSFDSEQHGKDLYAALVNGDYGDIAAE